MIFKLLPQEDLVCNVNVVCRRWRDLSTAFWTNMEMKKVMPKEMIHKWIFRAPLVKHLVIRDRRDLNEILERVSQHFPELETLEVYNGAGSRRSSRVRGVIMCDILKNCPRLCFIQFSGTRFNSCKFFSLLPKVRNLTNSKISYVGVITYKEFIALLESVKMYGNKNPTEICVRTLRGKCRLNLDTVNIDKLLNLLDRNKDRLISIIWNASKKLFNSHFNVKNLDVTDLL